MVSKSSYDELHMAYDERGALLFEAIHLLTKTTEDYWEDEDVEALELQINEFLSRARVAGFA